MNLALVLFDRFQRDGHDIDLERAVALGSAACLTYPDDHPDRAGALLVLGTLRNAQCRRGPEADEESAAVAFAAAADVVTAPPMVRAAAAIARARLAAGDGEWTTAASRYRQALTLLDAAAAAFLDQTDQEHQLAQLAGTASDAAACLLQLGRVDDAIGAFEQGRGILLGRAVGMRAVTALRATHPELFSRFAALVAELQASSARVGEHGPGAVLGRQRTLDRRRLAAATFEAVVAEIGRRPAMSVSCSRRQPPRSWPPQERARSLP